MHGFCATWFVSCVFNALVQPQLEKNIVEGGGAAGLAAVLAGKLPELIGKKVACVICGGNIDTTVLGR